jgi:hypothetical protein
VGLVFLFLLERFHVIDDTGRFGDAPGSHAEAKPVTEAEARSVGGAAAWRLVRIFVLFAPITWLALKDQATGAFEPIRQPVNPALLAVDEARTKFNLDANRNGMSVAFDHKKHEEDFLEVYGYATVEETCVKCHHLSVPADKNSSCRACHRDMEVPTPMFQLANHEERFEKPEDRELLLAANLADRQENFEACMRCHEENMPGLAAYAKKGFSHVAPGYVDAMHGSCLECHRLREQEKGDDPANPVSRGNCLFCHRDWADEGMFEALAAAEFREGAEPDTP